MSQRIHTVGRRKTSIARVFLSPGSGAFFVNGLELSTWVNPDTHWHAQVNAPLKLLEVADQFDVHATTCGGGITGQAGALLMAIARALDVEEQRRLGEDVTYEQRAWHMHLKKEGMLSRDSRMVERKKPGFRKARKKEQYSKR